MKTAKTLLLLALSASLGACAADEPGGGGGDGGSGGGPGGGEEEPTPSRDDASGKYTMRSNFDLATNAPGKVGEVVNTIIAATNDPDDPANWILEQMINQTSGTLKSFLNGVRPFVAGYINDQILSYAPDFVSTMVQLGNDFGQIAKNFGTNEELDVTAAGANSIDSTTDFTYMSTHTIVGAHFSVDGIESDHAFADYSMQNIVVQNVGVTLAKDGKFGVAQHTVPLSYGRILHIGMDEVLIPMIDPTAQNLGQLLQHQVNCPALAAYVASQLPIGGFTGALTTACNAGLVVAANKIYEKIDGIDGSALQLGLTGDARALDSNNDDKIDKIQTGTWAGTSTYGTASAPLAGATFFGSRMGVTP
jgi:hypothetical protein